MVQEREQQRKDSVLEDKEKFGKDAAAEKLGHMGDKPAKPGEKPQAGEKK
jgi:hypothetical protein